MSNNADAGPATVSGEAARIPAALSMQAQGGVLTAQITVTRAKTGQVEHYTLTAIPEQPKEGQ